MSLRLLVLALCLAAANAFTAPASLAPARAVARTADVTMIGKKAARPKRTGKKVEKKGFWATVRMATIRSHR